MGLGSFFRMAWKTYPEHIVMGAVVIIMFPFAAHKAYKNHHKPWYYKKEYTIFRDDDPYAKILAEDYKTFVPHKVPRF